MVRIADKAAVEKTVADKAVAEEAVEEKATTVDKAGLNYDIKQSTDIQTHQSHY